MEFRDKCRLRTKIEEYIFEEVRSLNYLECNVSFNLNNHVNSKLTKFINILYTLMVV